MPVGFLLAGGVMSCLRDGNGDALGALKLD